MTDPGKSYEYFFKWHFHNASKEVFWQKKFLNFLHAFKSAILAEWKNCQNCTFEPVHEIQKFFWLKAFFWSIMKMAIKKFFRNMSQGLPNPGFMQEKVQKGDFLWDFCRCVHYWFLTFCHPYSHFLPYKTIRGDLFINETWL